MDWMWGRKMKVPDDFKVWGLRICLSLKVRVQSVH